MIMKCELYLVILTACFVSVHCAEQTSPFHLSDIDEDSDRDSETVYSVSTDSDSDEVQGGDSSEYLDSGSDMDSDLEMDTDSITHTDLGTDGESDSGDNSSSDDESDCPGSCQYNAILPDSLIASGIAGGFYVDPSIEYYLMCTDQTGAFITHTENDIPIYDGWILDTSYECAEGLYCCRPQRSADKYCNETGGTCMPSDTIQAGSGFCAFPSNTCKEPE
jgi:hypothetical protein